MKSFVRQGVPQLKRLVGDGLLRSVVTVDQVYALDQHETLTYRHDGNRGPKYLTRALMENYVSYLSEIADGILRDGGRHAIIQSAVYMATRELWSRTPIEYENLKDSGWAQVFDDGTLIFERPADQHRLSEEELRRRAT
jgi:hypothetical protein